MREVIANSANDVEVAAQVFGDKAKLVSGIDTGTEGSKRSAAALQQRSTIVSWRQ
jgi:hypothetical protein